MKRLILAAVVVVSMLVQADDNKRNMRVFVDPFRNAQPLPMKKYTNSTLRKALLASEVQDWSLTGTRSEAYEVGCDETFGDCTTPILRTRPWVAEPFGMGSLTHTESAVVWRGARVELKAVLRSGAVDGWAGLWMRIDGAEGKALAFDNMQNRALRGTTAYREYTVVLDIPEGAERITFGVLLHGPGAVFIRELNFREVDASVQVTDLLGPLRSQSGLSAGK